MKFDSRLVDDWIRFWNTYDLGQVKQLFLDDNRVSYFSSEKKGLIKGIDALVKHHEGFGFIPGGKKQPNKLWLEEVNIEDFGPCASVTAVWCFKRGDSEHVQRGPVSIFYVESGGKFRIAHANFSNYKEP